MNAPLRVPKLFKTVFPDRFEILVNYSNGTCIEISPDHVFLSDLDSKKGLDLALVNWLNAEFSDNPQAQNRLKEIKAAETINSGHVAIQYISSYKVVSVDLFHTMCLISSMGYDIHANIDSHTKLVTSFTLNKM